MASEGSNAVVVPIVRLPLAPEERFALESLDRSECPVERVALAPEGLDTTTLGLKPLWFPRCWFRSRDDYSRLLLSSGFYEALRPFSAVLILQLDAIALANRFSWAFSLPQDFVGAPLLDRNRIPHRVGNGGLSLRRVQACLDVLAAPRPPVGRILRLLLGGLPDQPQPLQGFRRRLRVLRQTLRPAATYASSYTLNEDLFWSDRARIFDPHFRVAPLATGLEFAFDRNPEGCFAAARGRLPFGAHGWLTNGASFWRSQVPWLAA